MYSVMRDKPDARKVPMERGWVVLYLYATCKFSNLLTLEQWAFEYGLPFFFIRTVVHNFTQLYTALHNVLCMQGRIQNFHLGEGGHKIMYAHAHYESKGIQGP